MNGTQCIITGCELVGSDGAALRGDLFKCGDTYVFNGVVKDGKAVWRYGAHDKPNDTGKVIYYVGINLWERRGVIVMHESEVRLSKGALHYLETGQRL